MNEHDKSIISANSQSIGSAEHYHTDYKCIVDLFGKCFRVSNDNNLMDYDEFLYKVKR